MWSNLPEYPYIKYAGDGKFVATRREKHEVRLTSEKPTDVAQQVEAAIRDIESAPGGDAVAAKCADVLALLQVGFDRDAKMRKEREEILGTWDRLVESRKKARNTGGNPRFVAKEVELDRQMHDHYKKMREALCR